MSDASRQSSPKSSPRGSRSPAYPRTDSTGIPTLKIKIGQGKNPSVITSESGPFYLMKVKDQTEQSEPTGSSNLMSFYNLEHSYNKFSGKKLKEELSAFLPNLPGNIDTPGIPDNSSLRSIIEKPPITGKELIPLSGSQLTGFRLHPGPLPEQYRALFSQSAPQRRKKHKKHKKEAKESSQENMGAWFNNENNEEHDSSPITPVLEVMNEAEKKRKDKTTKDDKQGKREKKKKKKKKEKDKEVLLTS